MSTQQTPTNHAGYVIQGEVVVRISHGLERPLWAKNGSPLPIANSEGFRWIAGRWFTDGVHIIVQAQQGSSMAYEYYYRIEDADLESFEVLNERYARDARQAYYITGRTIRSKSPAAFHPLIYRDWRAPDEHGQALESEMRVHPYYAADNESIYVCGRRINGSDGASVEALSSHYVVDASHVYYYGRRIEADRASFVVGLSNHGQGPLRATDHHGPVEFGKRQTVLDLDQIEDWRSFFESHPQLHDYWWHRMQVPTRRGHEVEYRGHPLSGLDPDSFTAVEIDIGHDLHNTIVGDSRGIHWLGFSGDGRRYEPLPLSTQPITALRLLGQRYFTDGISVFFAEYHSPQVMRKVSPSDFRVLERGWARDTHRAFYQGTAKKGVNPERLQVAGCYAWDDAQLFCDGKPLKVATPHTQLSVPHPAFLLAGEQLFYGRRPVSSKRVHLPTLEFLDNDFARDRQHVYIVGVVNLVAIEGADLASFHITAPGKAKDATRSYDARTLRDETAPKGD
jgi:DKNYY family